MGGTRNRRTACSRRGRCALPRQFSPLFVAMTIIASISAATKLTIVASFAPPPPLVSLLPITTRARWGRSTAMRLVPLSEAWDYGESSPVEDLFAALTNKLGCPTLNSKGSLDGDDYQLCLATTEDDLPPVTQLTVDVFDATAINLSTSTDWSAFEKALLDPFAGGYNAYARGVAYAEVLSGLRQRTRLRRTGGEDGWLVPLVYGKGHDDDVNGGKGDGTGDDQSMAETAAAQSSLILTLAKTAKGDAEPEVVAAVELRLQPTDAKIPFSQPWLDSFERKLVARFFPDTATAAVSASGSLQPYLSNLAVSPSLRKRGVGRALVRLVAAVAQRKWGYRRLYLHVDPDNEAAVGLYEREGFVDVGRRWDPFWAGGAANIGYYVKNLDESSDGI